jgi:integral membrane protein (TIGR01906 family)
VNSNGRFRWFIKAIQIIVAVALPLALLTGNIQLLAHPRFVNFEYGKAGFPDDTFIPLEGYSLEKAERTALANAALRSIVGPEGMRALQEARFQKTGEPAFNEREIRHMRDVRWLFSRARVAFWVALAALLGGGALLLWWGRQTGQGHRLLTRPLLISVIATLTTAAALGLYILLNFDSFFTEFHHVFFEGSTWRFRRDDTLIRLFPTDFWFDAATIIAGLTAAELAFVGLGAWWWERRKRDAD